MLTRFAPSPTGDLHLGHAYSAVLAHDAARAAGGHYLIRIDDIDGSRSREEYVGASLADLEWLGLGWDSEPVRQSARLGDYAAAQAELEEALRVGEELGERVYLPQLLLLEAAVARGQGRLDAGSAAVRHAVEESRAQEAPWLELLALVELCGEYPATAGELQALAVLVERLSEAVDTAPVKRAYSILQAAQPT